MVPKCFTETSSAPGNLKVTFTSIPRTKRMRLAIIQTSYGSHESVIVRSMQLWSTDHQDLRKQGFGVDVMSEPLENKRPAP